ncbi:hypothetical protein [Pseudarthrobacter cellobiosi]|uniref:hypothetical protein n=1 Tax=Pseudarthrobacter cellobiosi TaxID=2953654 RepID=UPI00208E00A3|nr:MULTISPECIES: hypothetical protein [unclassified Pseudarthrobacter]MCO4254616.1 hypothetical protein [Pseudarthrobacter sp. HLT1-5]MCO4276705.1 hypothetical protein [Pseudarthrobacter sp. HLT3-5]
MAFLGGKSGARRSMPRGAAAAACMLVAAFGLSACEYADSEPLPGASTAALPPVPGDGPGSPSAQEEARQLELIAEVEAQLGPETDRRVASTLGGMGNTGSSLMGLVPDHGSYLIRVACSPSLGPAAKLTVSQGSVQLLDLQVLCGDPFESTVQLTAGRVTATLAPTSGGESSVAALRIEKAPAGPLAGPAPVAPASSSP